MNFRVEFDVGVNDGSIFSGNEQQVAVLGHSYSNISLVHMMLRQSTCDYPHVIKPHLAQAFLHFLKCTCTCTLEVWRCSMYVDDDGRSSRLVQS